MTESELLFSETLNYSRDKLYLNKNRFLSRKESCFLADALRRRIKGEPIQYILGKTEFMGLAFRLTPDVFIPRPETEILVEAVLDIVARHKAQGASLKILDIGTGSGCIAVSLAKFIKYAKVTAVDISVKALEIARQNALLNDVDISLLRGDIFIDCRLPITDFDLIIANPPYVPAAEIDCLEPELGYEPVLALDGGWDGLDFYRRIIKHSPACLKMGGLLIMEMGFGQCAAIKDLFSSRNEFNINSVIKDYNRIDRIIIAQLARRNG
ncbi:peptide chain release factor N(5)-glutamine methyltransferase [Candidatus Omnitrophota bacterium]